jgi:hypothetical protein
MRPSPPLSRQSGRDTLADHGPLELNENAEHLKQRLAPPAYTYRCLLVEVEVDTLRVDFRQHAEQVLERAAKPIDRPGGNHCGRL